MIPIKELWSFEEKSTRNCIHAKVSAIDKVKCSYHNLSKFKTNDGAIALSTVFNTPRFVSKSCLDCLEFEHDEEYII